MVFILLSLLEIAKENSKVVKRLGIVLHFGFIEEFFLFSFFGALGEKSITKVQFL